MTRAEFYEMLVYNLTTNEFTELFGRKPADIQALDYDFEVDVTWSMNLEMAYNLYINN